jgi:hypothetical protein
MIKYTADALNDILEKHSMWLKNDEGGCRANLDRVDLRDANLNRVNLSGASLVRADLNGAELYRANLENTNLMGANLKNADLREANLKHADLSFANINMASIAEANLELAELRRANLEWTDFSGANLKGANLNDAMLYGARLDTAIISPDTHINFPLACPEEGAFIGWKKCYLYVPVGEDAIVSRSPVLVKLCILNTAKRSSATTRKCRCDRAEVLDIQDMHGNRLVDVVACSRYYGHGSFTYKVGKVVSVDNFDDCRWHECAPGIHFFITRQEALEYNTRITII